MQYERWGLDELDFEATRSKKNKAKLLLRYKEINPANYGKALDAIIDRFGEDTFSSSVKNILLIHLYSMHTQFHDSESPYKPHSDISSFSWEHTKIGYDVIKGTHPVPIDMTESGNPANAKSLFGDADFWSHLRSKYENVFNELVDYWMQLSKNFEQKRGSVVATINPVAFIKNQFPHAFDVIHSYRKDFNSEDTVGITIEREPDAW